MAKAKITPKYKRGTGQETLKTQRQRAGPAGVRLMAKENQRARAAGKPLPNAPGLTRSGDG